MIENVMKNVLGFNEYIKAAHPIDFASYQKEYENYSNWLSPNFIKVGHIYMTNIPISNRTYYYAIDGKKVVLADMKGETELKFDTLYHISEYDPYSRELKSNFINTESDDRWVTKEALYKMFLVDVTNTEYPITGAMLYPIEENKNLKCPYNYRLLNVDGNMIEVLYTKFTHNSYEEWNSSTNKIYNKHNCDVYWKKYVFEYVKGTFKLVSVTPLDKIRLAADQKSWCVDLDINKDNKYKGSWSSLRKLKKEWFGVESFRKCRDLFIWFVFQDLFDSCNFKEFIPFPIKTF